jgi:hypothetical protein
MILNRPFQLHHKDWTFMRFIVIKKSICLIGDSCNLVRGEINEIS